MQPSVRIALPLLVLGLAGCGRESVTSVRPPVPVTSNARLMQITITGIGSAQPTASVRAVGPATESGAAAPAPGRMNWSNQVMAGRLTALPSTGGYDGTIQMSGVSVNSFTWGSRSSGGYRYISATFKVRNATSGGLAYTTARTNLTLMAVNDASSLSGTGISALLKFDNTAITSGLETQIQPTGWADLSANATLTTKAPDVLQVYTETEVGAATVPGTVISLQPYGFVVRNPSSTTDRTLAANPAVGQYDGLVTITYKVPLQATAADDPFTITGQFLAMDDAETWVTQTFEDTDATSLTALVNRKTNLVASARSVVSDKFSTVTAEFECTVRAGGTAATPTAYMAQGISASSKSPDPFSAGARVISATSPLSATFGQKMKGATFSSFVVNSFMGGRSFLSGSYGISGDSLTLSTPNPSFVPGDVVEVTLTGGLSASASGVRACPGTVYRYRVAAGAGSAAFVADSAFGVGTQPRPIGVGDFNGDGKLDMVVGNYNNGGTGSVTLLLGDGLGGFTAASGGPFTVGNGPRGIVVADFNGDGKLDFATANFDGSTLTVRLGDGLGGFGAATTITGVNNPQAITAGDVNGDGKIDLVAASTFNSTVTAGQVDVFLGDGAGGFTAAPGSPFTVGTYPYGVQLVDVNGDGILDLATANQWTSDVTVLLGDGTGRFTAAAGSPYAVGRDPSGLMVADINADGKPDLIVDNSGNNHIAGDSVRGTVSILLGNGTGGFTTMSGSPFLADSINTVLWGMDVGDVNGDGRIDVVVASRDSNRVTVMLNNGTGGFNNTTYALPSTTAARWVTLAPFKGDGKLAIAIAAFNANTIRVLLNP